MAAKKDDALKGEVEQIQFVIEERFLTMKNQMESRLGGMEEMIKKLMEMQSKAPPAVPIANPQHDLTGVPLAESKGKEIEREEFDKSSFFHQEPTPEALRRGGSGFPNDRTAGREFYGGIYGGGGRATDHYGRINDVINELDAYTFKM
ncbi:hypothetical protein M5K25_012277 [Dendrobium thyrsiflorum]|uniref:Uncharacterized protein n=1 Tax=Dendrobium thyrsiflorum TaxID=117978 RepID=A0ABD0UXA6_DENTH